MRKMSRWTNQEVDALKELVEIYGQHRPSDICHQLKHIYGIKKKREQVMSRCKILNAYFSTKDFTQAELNQIWELFKIKGDDFTSYPLDIKQLYIFSHLYKISFPVRKWKQLILQQIKRNANLLNHTFASNKTENRNRMKKMGLTIWMEALKLSKENPPEEDKIYKDVVVSCKKIFELLEPLVKKEVEQDKIFDYYEFKVNRAEIQNIYEHIFLIRRIKDIVQNNFEIKKKKRDDEDEDEEEDEKNAIPKLSQQEVDILRRSQLYQRLNPDNPRKFYYDWYHSSIKNHENDAQFSILFCNNEKKIEIAKEFNLDENGKPQKYAKLPTWKKIKNQRDQQISDWSKKFLEDIDLD